MKKFTSLSVALIIALMCVLTVACNATVTVSLHNYDGSNTVKQVYDPNEPLPTPVRDGYTFEGWYTDTLTTQPFVEGQSRSEDFHLYAKWTKSADSSPKKFTVTLVYNDGVTDNKTVQAEEGKPVVLAEPKRSDYRFDGWWTAQSGGEQWTVQPVTEDITLYARWTFVGDPSVVLPETLTVTPRTVSLEVGETQRLSVSVGPDNASDKSVNFASSNGNVVTVSNDGLISAVSIGSATVTVSCGAKPSVSASVQVTVTQTQASSSFGTREKPLTVAQAIALGKSLASNAWTEERVYVRGVVVGGRDNASSPTQGTEGDWQFCIADSASASQKLLVYFAELPSTLSSTLSNGDTVVVCGYMQNYKGTTIEIFHKNNVEAQIVEWTAGSGSQGGGSTVHTKHDFGNSYFAYVKCSYEGCQVYGRNEGKRNCDDMFDYSATKQAEIDRHYNDCTSKLNGSTDEFVKALAIFEDDVEYLDGQYSWASVYYSTDEYFDFKNVDSAYDVAFTNLCKLIVDADKKFNDFWDLYPEERDDVLPMAQMYANGSSSNVDGILDSYYEEMQQDYPDADRLDELYGQLVQAYNKQAQSYNYDNYMLYAYDQIYNREYGLTQIQQMRNFIKQYIVDAYIDVSWALADLYGYSDYIEFSTDANEYFYYGLMYESIFENSSYDYFEQMTMPSVNYIARYFEWLDEATVGVKPITFAEAVNEMFQKGTYFRGDEQGAYTLWVPKDEMAVCYFQQGDDEFYGYDDPFTFVHEFGHYYENIHNGGLALSYDHDETQLQGDEMLFLAWLQTNKASNITDGMTAVELEKLSYMLQTVIVSAAVDELEWSAYTGETTSNFGDKYAQILADYLGEDEAEYENPDYWYEVVFDNAGYYVSYAVSALPALEIYAISQKEGLNSARSAYLKLFTYCEDNSRMTNYTYTGANGVLDFAGLGNPFETSIYTDIKSCIDDMGL